MRFGIVLAVTDPDNPLPGLVRQAEVAEETGFDLVWLAEQDGLAAPAVVAAMLATTTEFVRVATAVRAGSHPVYLAEEAAVADLALNGRLILVLAEPTGDAGLLAETADVLLAASAARPFRHEGARWRIPANLPSNEFNLEQRVRITPAPAQIELPLWLLGPSAPEVARQRALCHVGDIGDEAAELEAQWRSTEQRLGPAAARLRRPAIRRLDVDTDGGFDDDALTGRLRAEQRGWGLDVAVLRLPHSVGDAGREEAVRTVARRVRPRVQLDRLPPGLEEFWKQQWRQEAHA